jgi:histidinol-phosphatase (PHP family)
MENFPAIASICDCHVHSHFSVDSTASIGSLCEGALRRSIGMMTISDHYDLHPLDEGLNYYQPALFFEEFERTRQRYAARLRLFKGLEFSEPHRYPEKMNLMQEQSYDVFLGAIHWVGDLFAGSDEAFRRYTPRQFYEAYYSEMLAAVRLGGFDILAHIDFPKRYLPVSIVDLPVLKEVLAAVVEGGIALEVNTSSLRRGLSRCLPDLDILEMYAAEGGSRITLGSDAHIADDIGAGFEYAMNLVRRYPQFQVGCVVNRQFIPLQV